MNDEILEDLATKALFASISRQDSGFYWNTAGTQLIDVVEAEDTNASVLARILRKEVEPTVVEPPPMDPDWGAPVTTEPPGWEYVTAALFFHRDQEVVIKFLEESTGAFKRRILGVLPVVFRYIGKETGALPSGELLSFLRSCATDGDEKTATEAASSLKELEELLHGAEDA